MWVWMFGLMRLLRRAVPITGLIPAAADRAASAPQEPGDGRAVDIIQSNTDESFSRNIPGDRLLEHRCRQDGYVAHAVGCGYQREQCGRAQALQLQLQCLA